MSSVLMKHGSFTKSSTTWASWRLRHWVGCDRTISLESVSIGDRWLWLLGSCKCQEYPTVMKIEEQHEIVHAQMFESSGVASSCGGNEIFSRMVSELKSSEKNVHNEHPAMVEPDYDPPRDHPSHNHHPRKDIPSKF